MKLPDGAFLYPITDRRLSGLSHEEQVRQLADAGARIIQLREKELPDDELRSVASSCLAICRAAGCELVLNDRLDLAAEIGCGVHLGQDDADPRGARARMGPRALIGYSAHSLSQLRDAIDLPIDYIAIGPVFATASKANADPATGTDILREAARHVEANGKRLVCIGGIGASNLSGVLSAVPAAGLAMIGALANGGRPGEAFRRLAARCEAPAGGIPGDVATLGERGLLELLGPMLRRHTAGLSLGTGDDVAITPPPPPGQRLVWTIDTMIEGTHFRRWPGVSMRSIGRKLVATNLSDLASKGAAPLYGLVSLGVPPTAPASEVADLYRGLDEALSATGARLLGGDTVRAPGWTLTLALVGTLDSPLAIAARAKAKAGQSLYVTGWPGESAAGLRILESGDATLPGQFPDLVLRHLEPTARLAEGRALVSGIDDLAMIDVSDGIVSDCDRLAEASGCRVVLDVARLPVSARLREFAPDATDILLHGGEDYELLFAASAGEDSIHALLRDHGISTPVSRIGAIESGSGVWLRQPDGSENHVTAKGFQHFP